AGFVARLREERFRVPFPFNRDLRQQQSAMPGPLDDETVPADFNVGRTGDRLERAQKRQLDLECRQLRGGDRRKSWIRAARRDSAPFQHAPKRLVRLDMTDAPAELAVIV